MALWPHHLTTPPPTQLLVHPPIHPPIHPSIHPYRHRNISHISHTRGRRGGSYSSLSFYQFCMRFISRICMAFEVIPPLPS